MSCKECNAQFGLFKKSRPCGACKKVFCKQCTRGFLLLNNLDVEVGVVVDPNDPVPVCKACFKKESTVDHSRVYDAYGPVGGEGMVFVHGNMATRRMFCSLVREVLAIRPHSRIFCVDMPGHGSRMEEELTMKSAVAAVKEAVDRISQEFVEFHVAEGESENDELLERARPAVMGYSMGSYISMACMGSCSAWKVVPSAFMIGGGGFNMNRTGAGLGLSLFGLFTIKLKGELAVAKSVQAQFPKTPVPLIQECFYRAGGHPDIWPKSQAMLLSCNYAEALGRYDGPSLFFRGASDLSDADELWIQSAKNGKLAVIEGGDHLVFVEFGKETAAVLDKFLSSLSPEDAADKVDGRKSDVKDEEEAIQEQTEAASPQEDTAEQREAEELQEDVAETKEEVAEPQSSECERA